MRKDTAKSVLIVDDSPFFVRTLHEMLEDEYNVDVAFSGEEAIERVKKVYFGPESDRAKYDLVITDLKMREKSGYDVAEYVRATGKENRYTPVIMLSEMNITSEDAREHGCAAFIPKSNLNKIKFISRILTRY